MRAQSADRVEGVVESGTVGSERALAVNLVLDQICVVALDHMTAEGEARNEEE